MREILLGKAVSNSLKVLKTPGILETGCCWHPPHNILRSTLSTTVSSDRLFPLTGCQANLVNWNPIFIFLFWNLSTSSKVCKARWCWWWIVFMIWLTDERRLTLFPAGTIVRDPHHRESPTHREQDLNLCRTWVQALLNEVVH